VPRPARAAFRCPSFRQELARLGAYLSPGAVVISASSCGIPSSPAIYISEPVRQYVGAPPDAFRPALDN